MSEEKTMTLEESFEALDEIIHTLQDPETTLEESFAAYKNGMDHIKTCNEMIDRVEKQVQILSEGGNIDAF